MGKREVEPAVEGLDGRYVDVDAAAGELRSQLNEIPSIGIVLGSGLGGLVDRLEHPTEVPFTELPGLPAPGVSGHRGGFVAGRLEGVPVLLQAGRYHRYEGHTLDTVVAPTRIVAELGVRTLLMSSAVGGLDRLLAPGDIVLLDDILNVTLTSPLAGPVRAGESRFPDMSRPFDSELQSLVLATAASRGIAIKRGVYAGVLGPSYETAAEVRMLRQLGGDVVGMSTVPEVIAAAARGMRVVGLSLVTNLATGLSPEPLSHEEVLAVGADAAQRMGDLVAAVVGELGSTDQSADTP